MEKDVYGIGARIRAIRLLRELTQKQLGDLCGMADSAIRRYESGRGNPTEKTLKRIANALGVSVQDLLKDSQPYTSGTLEAGNSYMDGKIVIKEVNENDGKLSLTFVIDDESLTDDEIRVILNRLRHSMSYGKLTISLGNNKKAAPGAANTGSGKDDTDH